MLRGIERDKTLLGTEAKEKYINYFRIKKKPINNRNNSKDLL